MLIITVPILVNALLPCHLMDPTLVVIDPLNSLCANGAVERR